MRVFLPIASAIAIAAGAVTIAAAQDAKDKGGAANRHSTGETYMPAHERHTEQQPQGPTGPLDTTTGGAPAESPQGQTPPGMQAAPEGSSKSIVDDKR